jgi:beta-galactosidase
MKRTPAFFLINFCIFFRCFVAAVQNLSQQKKINIDDGRKFHFGNAADPAKDLNYGVATIFARSGGDERTATVHLTC